VERARPFSGEDTTSKQDKLIFQALESPTSVVANSQALLSRDSVYNASWDLVYLADPMEDLNVVCQMLSRVECAAPNKTRAIRRKQLRIPGCYFHFIRKETNKHTTIVRTNRCLPWLQSSMCGRNYTIFRQTCRRASSWEPSESLHVKERNEVLHQQRAGP
jgi:hypothetical protein